MTTREGKSKKMKLPSLFKGKNWRINKLFKIRANQLPPKVTELSESVKSEEPSPSAVKLSWEPVASLGRNLQQHREDITPQESKPERELNEIFIASQGIKLTAAAKELSDEEWRLLYEDIFKPLDFYSILHERSKKLS